jgi:hypothetical protein
MTIHTKDLETFKAIYKDKFWKELSNNEALEYATALLNFTKILLLNKNKIC